jgi:uncharacterized protein YjcR
MLKKEVLAQNQNPISGHWLIGAKILMSPRRNKPLQRKSDIEKFKSQVVKEEFYLKLQNQSLAEFIQLQEAYYEHCQSIIKVRGVETNPFGEQSGIKHGHLDRIKIQEKTGQKRTYMEIGKILKFLGG